MIAIVSTVAKASQLIFGGISKSVGMAQNPARLLNLTAGVVSAGAAAQASDMTGQLILKCTWTLDSHTIQAI